MNDRIYFANRFLAQIEKSILHRSLIQRGEKVLVTVSGGVDSMVLLHALHELSQKHKWKLSVAHFNHQLRGRSSDADERLAQKTAEKRKLKFVAGRADVKAFAKQKKLSVEMAARELRHQFFAQTAKKLKIQTIALAHHADDQVELFFLRLLRGSGTEGLGGMNWKSLSPADSSLHLIRPLLDQSKKDLLDYAVSQKIHFREDASNANKDFLRNRVRHEVVPLLKKLQPGVDKTVLRTMEITAAESNFVLVAARDWLSAVKKKPLEKLDIAVQRVGLRLQLKARGLPSDFALIEKLRLQPGCVISIIPNQFVSRDEIGNIVLEKREESLQKSERQKINLTKQNKVQFGETALKWSVQNKRGDSFRREANCELFDGEKVGEEIVLRHWEAGDRFQPIGMKAPVKLQDLFINLKVSRVERHRRILAETKVGEIFWVEGLRISERFKLDKQSRRRLKWHWLCP